MTARDELFLRILDIVFPEVYHEWAQPQPIDQPTGSRRAVAEQVAGIVRDLIAQMEAPMNGFETTEMIAALRRQLAAVDETDRLTIIGRITEGYCPGCGTDQLPCHCQNDE